VHRAPLLIARTPVPGLAKVTLYQDTWLGHVLARHPEMRGMDGAVLSVLTAPSLVTLGGLGQSGVHNFVFTNDTIRSPSGRARLAVIVDPRDAVVCTALFHAGSKITSGKFIWSP